VLLLAAVLIAGLLLDLFLPVLAVGLVVYGIASARTYFDEDEANKVLERERGKRHAELEKPRIDVALLAPEIAGLVRQAHERRARIAEAIERAELPYEEVSSEVDRFVTAIEQTAGRAELLYEALADTPPATVEARLREVAGQPERAELQQALTQQLEVQQRMGMQLQRFYDQMERLLVELDTVRGDLVSASASTEAANQQRLAAEVRGLRDEVGALAQGMSEAYEEPEGPTRP
jgi:chromosome segregation ATPase